MATPKKKKQPKKPVKKATARKPTKPARKAAKKPAAKKATAKKPAIKKPAAKKSGKPTAKKSAKPAPKKSAPIKAKKSAKPLAARPTNNISSRAALLPARVNHAPKRLDAFTKGQRDKLLQLRDSMVDAMAGVAQDTLRSRAEGSEASAFGMHQADAGSDAYDRDFALSLLSQEQDALYEIDQALKRIEQGTYGVCEMSNKAIPHMRLEAIPFARFTVECQSQLEKQNKQSRVRQSVTSLFGLTDDEAPEGEEEEKPEAKSSED